MNGRVGLVLVALTHKCSHFVEGLVDAGFDVVSGQWGLPEELPLVLVTDQPSCNSLGMWRERYPQQVVGSIFIGPSDTVTETPEPWDACLPSEVSPRELHNVVRLVARVTMLRRQQFEQLRHERQWVEWALQDSLTGLPNRRHWEMELQRELATQPSLVIAMIDVDLFKQINDADGHHIGDRVLREVAAALKEPLRRSDFLARVGGDEFGLLLPNTTADDAVAIIDRLRNHASQQLEQRLQRQATLSAGLVQWSRDLNWSSDDIFARTSQTLRIAKGRNRNCTVIHATTVAHC